MSEFLPFALPLIGDEEINEEVIRVLKLMPDWLPGMQEGNAIAVRYALPFSLILE